MRVCSILLLLPLIPGATAVSGTPCLSDWAVTVNGCDNGDALEAVIATITADLPADCPHDAVTELDLISNGAGIESICADAWSLVDTTSFTDVDTQFNNAFMTEYVAGDTFLNKDTGTFQGTTEGDNIDIFRNEMADSTVLQGFDPLLNCAQQSIMCCFGRDRQPNDDNGNCAEPLDTKCIDADPADNSNLCYTEHKLDTFSDPFAFPGKSEGPIHCHGLAWSDDDNDFISQLKFNNFFYVSLYDHMYTRGYVETTVDSDNIPMCACVEEMPKVSRADCTEIAAALSFTISYSANDAGGILEANSEGDLAVEFNACNGINPGNGNDQDNDLASYVYRLNQEGKLSDTSKDIIFQTLVGYAQPGNNENEAQCEEAFQEEFGEAYPENVESYKCPLANEERLFRTEDANPLTLEECHWLCYDTEGCQYFSIGTSPGNDNNKGVCIGCTSEAVLEAHNGFNAYEMTDTQVFPTPAPTPDPEEYDTVGQDIKCPHTTRLFRTANSDPLSMEECYQKCYDTPFCDYFTLGVDPSNPAYVGICMGCTAESSFSGHEGFTTYEMVVTQDFFPSTDEYTFLSLHQKCPLNNRLFRTPDNDPLTVDECFAKCDATDGCEFFTVGGPGVHHDKWEGVCMGCSTNSVLEDHTGFHSYEMNAP